MKDKTYKWVLCLFLTLFFSALLFFSIFNFKDNLSRVKESYLREYYFLVNSMTKDLIVMREREYEIEQALEICYKDYSNRYNRQAIYLQFYQGDKCIYSSFPEDVSIDSNKMGIDKKVIETQVIAIDKLKYMRVYGYLPGEYNEYALVFYTEITKVINEWLKNIFYILIGAIIFSIILSICLMILMQYLFRPLEKISAASKRIALGEYEERIDIKSEGEIGEVISSFNTMADKIREQRQRLE